MTAHKKQVYHKLVINVFYWMPDKMTVKSVPICEIVHTFPPGHGGIMNWFEKL